MPTALITGVTGQDGSYLAEYLLGLGYKVFGTVRRNPGSAPWMRGMLGKIEFVYADLRDSLSIETAVRKAWPDEVYNLAGQTTVPLSWTHAAATMDVNAGGPVRVMDAVLRAKPDARIYQASTSEMFGHAGAACDESTPFKPDSPYAVAKHAAHELAGIYRTRGLHVSCGICFNHESPRRGPEFVTSKIAAAVAKWSIGSDDKLTLGDTSARRDWGFAGDYVRAMHAMLQKDMPGDYVVGMGESHSVRDFVRACCWTAGISAYPEHLIAVDERLKRSNDIMAMTANPTKAHEELGWKPEIDFDGLAEIMVRVEVVKEQVRRSYAETGRSVSA